MSRSLQALAVTLTLVLAFTFTSADEAKELDVEVAGQNLIDAIRGIANQAKKGNYLQKMRTNVQHLQDIASDLLAEFPGGSECDAQLTIKMAAARTGSHEVLSVLTAKDELAVLNGRLSLSLGFLEEVAELIQDDLSLSADLRPHLTAIIFGTNVTLDIIDDAENTIKAVVPAEGDERVRRSLDLGGGWSVGGKGVSWTSSNGRFTAYASPTFSGSGLGAKVGFSLKF